MVRAAQPETFTATDHSAVSHTSAMIADDTIVDGDINSSAAITWSKIAHTHKSEHEDGGADEFTAPLDVRATNSNAMVVLFPEMYNSIGQGTFSWAGSAARWHGGLFYNSASPSDGDNYTIKAFLSKGTYTLRGYVNKSTDYGVLDVDIDGVEVASVDLYNDPQVVNQSFEQTSIAVAASGIKDIRLRVDGKNASSTGYVFAVHGLVFWRTA